MQERTKVFMTRHLENLKKAGEALEDDQVLFPAVPADRYLNSEAWKVNAKVAAKSIDLPEELWNEVTLHYRKTFGISVLLETLFFMGFAVGWMETRALDEPSALSEVPRVQ